jgi:hypothetical protein
MGRLCYPTQFRPKQNPLSGHKLIEVGKGGYACPDEAKRRRGRGFCHLLASVASAKEAGYKFNRRYVCRGTKLISGTNLSRFNKCYKMGTGAVSRYKFDRSRKTVTVQDLFCGQMRALTAVASAKAGVRVQVSAGFVLGTGV